MVTSIKESLSDRLLRYVNVTAAILIAFAFLYPIVYIISASLSNPLAVEIGEVVLFPKGPSLASYQAALSQAGLGLAYLNGAFITVVGTIVNIIFTVLGAYVLSKPYLKGRTILTMFVVFTMWFDPGIIPKFVNFRDLGLLDSYNAPILGFAINTFNLIILRTFFEGIPVSLEESAKLDGARPFTIMWKIYVPLSPAALATVSLLYGVSRWNGYFWTSILLRDDNKIPLQVFLRKLVIVRSLAGEASQTITDATTASPQTIIYAIIMISLLPMLVAYPFIQKYFRGGVNIGAVKG